ncbi:2-keto-4-pentenoate hydratase [Microbaculum marinisediminis]|uniref:Fumarylacetoacetate hydrolase family protein n=1 Tax=Microbaculum marinisediminis TaxID=2931392 RepID=A0AAW5R103_9HYPH|nr:fumarylacetoacetate hydrolase family protein [Microbaculum sp. A6E488]MCT8973956.1 fumarylacetoacetate hydrolase family protein [Microbaculum sp. A6E488]
MTTSIEDMAATLFEARSNLRQIAPLRETMGLARIEDALAVQESVTGRWLDRGRRLVGRKIGLTAEAVQKQMGVDEPDYGVLWADYAFSDGDTVDMARFMQPRAEAEIAFVMDRGLADPDAAMTDVIRAVAYAVPALEVIDSAIADWNIGLVDTVADNASGGGFVLGKSPRRISDVDLRLCGMIMSRNGAQASLGLGAACLGHPLTAVLWLVRKMASIGRPVEEGDIILSGSLGPVVPIAAGDEFSVEIQGFEPFHVGFAG